MLAIPKTPKRCAGAKLLGCYTPRLQATPKRGPMPMSHFQSALFSINRQVILEEQENNSVSTPAKIPFKMFNPEHTSTLASIPSRETTQRNHKRESPMEIGKQLGRITDIEEDEDHEELSLDAPSPIPFSPEPRPSSAPISNRALFQSQLPPRPRTTEPAEHKQALMPIRTPPRRRAVKKATFSKTPHCARPTISWLNRIKSNQ